MMAACALSSILLLCAGLCLGQDLVLPPGVVGEVGGDVVITPSMLPPRPYRVITWRSKTGTIVNVFDNNIIPAPDYMGRVSLDLTSLALELRNLTLDDTGEYELFLQTSTSAFTKQTTLEVFEPASNVTVTPKETELVEFNSTVSLACSASGSSLSFKWFNGSSEITLGEHVQLTNGNRTLNIITLSRVDTGPYACEASNAISTNRSQAVTLTIYYGPDKAFVEAKPLKTLYISETDLTLKCSAESSPAAEIQWAVNGTVLSKNGPELNLTNIQSSQRGNYTCTAYNTKTLRYSTSEPFEIVVLEKISEATLTGPTELVFEGNSTSITCDARGTITSVEWMKDNWRLSPSDSIIFSPDNRSVQFSPVSRTDRGEYQCFPSNPVSSNGSKIYRMSVNFGPDGLQIIGPNAVEEEGSLTLECISKSFPEASYSWQLNKTETEVKTALFTVTEAKPTDSGQYTCTAWNPVTGRTDSASHTLEVKEKGSLGGGGESLSAGAIAGITIGVLLVVALVAGLTVYFTKFSGRPEPSSRGDKRNGATKNGGEHELNYAEIRHNKNNQSVISMTGSTTQTRHGTPAMVRAHRGAPQPQGANAASEANVTYAEVKK